MFTVCFKELRQRKFNGCDFDGLRVKSKTYASFSYVIAVSFCKSVRSDG
ncbi:hypothetical protein ACZ87_00508 [Candidatus Erwinia dacicola]|uniref:Uncharacterized protein n=1 Tax=Candidatus Erwinia dacicola TaxID=252393 RepID=A0A328TV84_9GAMM|nr:hypothetical protein ACZ87_00508 [Candidatus Erwinia dacicola]